MPDLTPFIPYGSHLLSETRTLRQALISDLSNNLFGELPNDRSLLRLRQLRESVIEGALNNGAWYRPGDVLPHTDRVTLFHLVTCRIFSLFRPETLVYILNYISQANIPSFENTGSLGAIGTIFLFTMLRPLFVSFMPASFWLLSFDRIRLFLVTSIEHLLSIFSLGFERISYELETLSLNSSLRILDFNLRNLIRVFLHSQVLSLRFERNGVVRLFDSDLGLNHIRLQGLHRTSIFRNRILNDMLRASSVLALGISGVILFHNFDSVSIYINAQLIALFKAALASLAERAGVGAGSLFHTTIERAFPYAGGLTIGRLLVFLFEGGRLILRHLPRR